MNIIELAKEAGFSEVEDWNSYVCDQQRLERFAALVRAEALEEAAKVCDDESRYSNDAECCAAAIRRLK